MMSPEQRYHMLKLLEMHEYSSLVHSNYHQDLFDEECLVCQMNKTIKIINEL